MLIIDTNPHKNDIQQSGIQHNDILGNDTQHNSILENNTQHDENQQNDIPSNLNSSKCQVNDPQHKVLYFFIV